MGPWPVPGPCQAASHGLRVQAEHPPRAHPPCGPHVDAGTGVLMPARPRGWRWEPSSRAPLGRVPRSIPQSVVLPPRTGHCPGTCQSEPSRSGVTSHGLVGGQTDQCVLPRAEDARGAWPGARASPVAAWHGCLCPGAAARAPAGCRLLQIYCYLIVTSQAGAGEAEGWGLRVRGQRSIPAFIPQVPSTAGSWGGAAAPAFLCLPARLRQTAQSPGRSSRSPALLPAPRPSTGAIGNAGAG